MFVRPRLSAFISFLPSPCRPLAGTSPPVSRTFSKCWIRRSSRDATTTREARRRLPSRRRASTRSCNIGKVPACQLPCVHQLVDLFKIRPCDRRRWSIRSECARAWHFINYNSLNFQPTAANQIAVPAAAECGASVAAAADDQAAAAASGEPSGRRSLT